MRRKNILMIGPPRIGKTTVFERLVKHHARRVGGIITKEMKNDFGTRFGFRVCALDRSESAVLARRGSGTPRHGVYRVNELALTTVAIPAIDRAIADAQIIAIDEIARMQMVSPDFCRVVLAAFDSSKIVLATIHQEREPFARSLRERDDVLVCEFRPDNRDTMVETIEMVLMELLHPLP